MVKVLDTVVKVKVYESKEELCVSFGLPFVCSTQIIVYAKHRLFTLFKHQRSNLKVCLNKIQKTEGSLLTKTQYTRGERSKKVLFLFVE